MINSAPQLASSPSIQAFGKDVIREVLSGVSLSIAKPLLAIEMRRIMPTVAGLPLELSLYTAAVAAAAVRGETGTSFLTSQNILPYNGINRMHTYIIRITSITVLR